MAAEAAMLYNTNPASTAQNQPPSTRTDTAIAGVQLLNLVAAMVTCNKSLSTAASWPPHHMPGFASQSCCTAEADLANHQEAHSPHMSAPGLIYNALSWALTPTQLDPLEKLHRKDVGQILGPQVEDATQEQQSANDALGSHYA
jgi:hypothetical protein